MTLYYPLQLIILLVAKLPEYPYISIINSRILHVVVILDRWRPFAESLEYKSRLPRVGDCRGGLLIHQFLRGIGEGSDDYYI